MPPKRDETPEERRDRLNRNNAAAKIRRDAKKNAEQDRRAGIERAGLEAYRNENASNPLPKNFPANQPANLQRNQETEHYFNPATREKRRRISDVMRQGGGGGKRMRWEDSDEEMDQPDWFRNQQFRFGDPGHSEQQRHDIIHVPDEQELRGIELDRQRMESYQRRIRKADARSAADLEACRIAAAAVHRAAPSPTLSTAPTVVDEDPDDVFMRQAAAYQADTRPQLEEVRRQQDEFFENLKRQEQDLRQRIEAIEDNADTVRGDDDSQAEELDDFPTSQVLQPPAANFFNRLPPLPMPPMMKDRADPHAARRFAERQREQERQEPPPIAMPPPPQRPRASFLDLIQPEQPERIAPGPWRPVHGPPPPPAALAKRALGYIRPPPSAAAIVAMNAARHFPGSIFDPEARKETVRLQSYNQARRNPRTNPMLDLILHRGKKQ